MAENSRNEWRQVEFVRKNQKTDWTQACSRTNLHGRQAAIRCATGRDLSGGVPIVPTPNCRTQERVHRRGRTAVDPVGDELSKLRARVDRRETERPAIALKRRINNGVQPDEIGKRLPSPDGGFGTGQRSPKCRR